MLNINGKNLCEHCFAELYPGNSVCSYCSYPKNNEKYPTALPEGSILAGRYVVGRVLGKGGFGVTYLCYDSKERTRVAIKEYLPDSLTHRNTGETSVATYGGESEEYFKTGAQKFYDEAKLVSRFNGNPNIISVYEFFYENNTTYFVMEYLDGIDLKHYVCEKGGKISEEEALFIGLKMSEALMIVHSTDVLHRDISPDNIFLCKDGKVKLIDFGAARQVVGEASKSLSVILKQGFAPLEQYQKKGKQGPWTDIYALGASLYYALTGEILDDAMSRISDDGLNLDGITPEFADILRKMLAVKMNDRYQNTFELKTALSALAITPKPFEAKSPETLVNDPLHVTEKQFERVVAPPVQQEYAAQPENQYAAPPVPPQGNPGMYYPNPPVQKKKINTKAAIIAIAGSLVGVLLIVLSVVFIAPEIKYQSACSALKKGDYLTASREFKELDDYKDSKKKIIEADYGYACKKLDDEEYSTAVELFEELDGYEDSEDKILEAKYGMACDLLEDGEYEEAIDIFEDLGDYQKSTSKIKEAKYLYAADLIKDKKFAVAIKLYEELGSYKESKEKLKEAKYQYCLANKSKDDTNTVTYLKELKKIGYKDSADVYDELFAWKVVEIAVNSDKEDYTTNMSSISKYKSVYIHFKVVGGEPGETQVIKTVADLPNGNTSENDSSGYEFVSGETSWVGWSDSIYVSPGENSPTGTLSFRFYDEEGNLIGEGSVEITE